MPRGPLGQNVQMRCDVHSRPESPVFDSFYLNNIYTGLRVLRRFTEIFKRLVVAGVHKLLYQIDERLTHLQTRLQRNRTACPHHIIKALDLSAKQSFA